MPPTASPLVSTTLQLGNEWLTVRAGGLNRYAAGLAGGLDAVGAKQQWLVTGREAQLGDSPSYVHAVSPTDVAITSRWRGMRQAFGNAILKSPDVVASHFALYAYPVRRQLRGLPHVVHFHGPWAEESSVEGAGRLTSLAKKHIEKAVYRTGDRFITLSRAFAQVLAQRYGVAEERIRVVPGGVDHQEFDTGLGRREARERLGWPSDRPIVLCVRRLARRMGIKSLIQAIGLLKQTHPDLLVLIAGKGPLESELLAQIEREQLSQHVQLLGFVPDEDLPIAYRAADFSIVPTQSLEGFGLIVLESLAAGTPALVTPVGGLPEVLEGFASQLVLESPKTESIASGLEAALSGAIELPSSEACQTYARESFAWPSIALRVLEVYEEARNCR